MNRGVAGILGYFGLWWLTTSVLAWPVARAVEAIAPGVFPFSRIFGRVELGVALVFAVLILPAAPVSIASRKGESARCEAMISSSFLTRSLRLSVRTA